jgi:hypothetical protein
MSGASREDAFEPLQSAQSADGALLVQLDRDLMRIVAALLAGAGAADRWREAASRSPNCQNSC